MTERKPANVDFETWIDQQIREAEARGEFENLPGKGRPLAGLDQPTDELWWVRNWLQRENVQVPAPPALSLRKEVHDLQDRLDREPTEACVRRVVEELNGRIRALNRMPPIDGPPTTVSPLDVDEVVERWRARRPVEPVETQEPPPPLAAPPAKRSWLRRTRRISPSS
ncbi:MAG TPA: DUF1992 domain-containing protein [Acidimicrobiales bacterium]|nr:DUF1992 domain-containing protein [Acidimicrobiales bacterium]